MGNWNRTRSLPILLRTLLFTVQLTVLGYNVLYITERWFAGSVTASARGRSVPVGTCWTLCLPATGVMRVEGSMPCTTRTATPYPPASRPTDPTLVSTRNILGHFRQKYTSESMSAMLGVGEAGSTCSKMASVHKDTCCLCGSQRPRKYTYSIYSEITKTPVSFKHFYEYYMVILSIRP